MEGLIHKYTLLSSFDQLEGVRWDNVTPDTRYTYSTNTQKKPSIAGVSGLVEVKRFGGYGTMLVLINETGELHIRTCSDNVWRGWL